jgi:sulfide dehydrogenase cytochrome subunit
MLASMCAGCHGTNGASVGPSAPIIAKSDKGVFVETMKGYKSGEIFSTVMGRIAKGYSDEEIEQMAVFFNEQKFVPAKQSFDEGLVKTGAKLHDKYCEKCHSEGGKPVVGTKKEKGGKDEDEDEGGEDYYLMAGQWTPYLKFTMSDFREERRPMPKKMGKQLAKLIEKDGDKGLDALWAYYASQQ